MYILHACAGMATRSVAMNSQVVKLDLDITGEYYVPQGLVL